MKKSKIIIRNKNLMRLIQLLIVAVSFVSCSTTKNIPDDDQLYTGLTKIKYDNYEKNSHLISTQEEIEETFAAAPNG